LIGLFSTWIHSHIKYYFYTFIIKLSLPYNFMNITHQQLKKKTWSAPMIMTVFIITSMLMVFSCEQIGLFRKENNLETQAIHIGKIQQTISKKFENTNDKFNINESIITKINNESVKEKEKTQEKMMNILMNGLEVN